MAMSKVTLQSYIAEHRSKINALKTLDRTSINPVQGETYNVYKMCRKDKSDHQRLFQALIKNQETLFEGYNYSMVMYREFLMKKKGAKIAVRVVPIGGEKIIVRKSFGVSEQLDSDLITPGRYNMVLTLAAASFYRVARDGKEEDFLSFCKAVIEKVKNPIAMQHGFRPTALPESKDDANAKMVFYYLVTTIGFDALTFISAPKALAICAYRGIGTNPLVIGLTNGLKVKESDFVEKKFYNGGNAKLMQRIQQGVVTKEFEYGSGENKQLLKPDQAFLIPSFVVKYQQEIGFLCTHANPTKRKVQRHSQSKLMEKQFLSQ